MYEATSFSRGMLINMMCCWSAVCCVVCSLLIFQRHTRIVHDVDMMRWGGTSPPCHTRCPSPSASAPCSHERQVYVRYPEQEQRSCCNNCVAVLGCLGAEPLCVAAVLLEATPKNSAHRIGKQRGVYTREAGSYLHYFLPEGTWRAYPVQQYKE